MCVPHEFPFRRRHFMAMFFVVLLSIELPAQNIGIGNTNPAFKLDMSGRMRLRGGSNNNFTAGLWLGGTGADSVVNKFFVGMATDSSAGFYTELNSNGWSFLVDGLNGRVGIRNLFPHYPLSFKDVGGDKISLYRDGNGMYYGLGVGNATLQLTTPHSSSAIIFGYGLSNAFTENMRLTGTGLLGIGNAAPALAGITVDKKVGAVHALFGSNTTGVAIESEFPGIGFNNYYNGGRKAIANGYAGYIGVNPVVGGMSLLVSAQSINKDATGTYKTAIDIKPDGKVGIGVTDAAFAMDVAGRMRIRGNTGFTAGLWLNNEANSVSPAFIGMKTDNEVGFYGSGNGWGITMNTQNGEVAVGGQPGQAGQVLTSNGAGAAPSWQSSAGAGKYFVQRPSANSPDLGTSGRVDVPSMVANFTLTATSQVVFNYKLSIANRGCVACGERRTFIFLVQNIVGGTTDIASSTVYTPNGEIADGVSGPIEMVLAPGTYSFKLAIAPSIYGAATVYARQQEGIFTWQIFPL